MARRRILEWRFYYLYKVLIRVSLVQDVNNSFCIAIIGFRPFLFCIWLQLLNQIISWIYQFFFENDFKWISSRKECQLSRSLIIYHFVFLTLLIFAGHINQLKHTIFIRQVLVCDKLEPIFFRRRSKLVPSIAFRVINDLLSFIVKSKFVVCLLFIKQIVLSCCLYWIRNYKNISEIVLNNYFLWAN